MAAPVGGRHAIDEKFQQLVLEEISTLKADIDLERSERLQEDDQIVASPCSACLHVTTQPPVNLLVKGWSVCDCMVVPQHLASKSSCKLWLLCLASGLTST